MTLWCIADDSMPFDTYCPTVAPKVTSRTCTKCKQYHPSKVALKAHKQAGMCSMMGVQQQNEIVVADSSDDDEAVEDNDLLEQIGAIVDKNDAYLARFEEINDEE